MRWRNRFQWPREVAGGRMFRSDIKVLATTDLDRLTEAAVSNPRWSAEGRPDWLRRNRDEIKSIFMTIYGSEGRNVLRCLVMIKMNDDATWKFTLDLDRADFERLPDASPAQVVSLAHAHLYTYPSLDLDPEQQAGWDRAMEAAVQSALKRERPSAGE
ncbi:hypothetical protein GCM10009839_43600 [Catenulispora yoronensis]|uniref:Uncharacterized protein n=1 Tax=Catenulispora yoronensis TaxID=450799 RepID=A0ABN2UH70_9ACTN